MPDSDDYITKPFETDELLARMQGIFRRQAWLSAKDSGEDTFEFNGRKINFSSFEAEGPGGKFKLSRKECMIVKYMVERRGEVIKRDDLLDAVWGYDSYPSSRTVDNFIVRLRKIFEDNPREPVFFETIRGVGYRFAKKIHEISSEKSRPQERPFYLNHIYHIEILYTEHQASHKLTAGFRVLFLHGQFCKILVHNYLKYLLIIYRLFCINNIEEDNEDNKSRI